MVIYNTHINYMKHVINLTDITMTHYVALVLIIEEGHTRFV